MEDDEWDDGPINAEPDTDAIPEELAGLIERARNSLERDRYLLSVFGATLEYIVPSRNGGASFNHIVANTEVTASPWFNDFCRTFEQLSYGIDLPPFPDPPPCVLVTPTQSILFINRGRAWIVTGKIDERDAAVAQALCKATKAPQS